MKININRILFVLIALGNHLIPKKKQIVLHSFPDVEDQMVAVLQWLKVHPESSCPVLYLISGNENEARQKLRLLVGEYASLLRIIKKTRLAAIWGYMRSRQVLFTHGIYGFLPVPRCQRVVNLWHGMPLKRIWKGLPGSSIPQCTWLLCTSTKFSEVLALASGFPATKIPAVGLPRNDLLFSRTAAAHQFGRRMRDDVDRVLFFLPTYRQSKVGYISNDGLEKASALAMSAEEVIELQQMLTETGTRMLVKPHPMSVHYGRNDMIDERLWIVSDEWLHQQGVTLYEALGQMDALVTDVSSVYVDYLCLRRPVFFYFPDLQEYRQTRSFIVEPLEDWLAGVLCLTASQLTKEIRKFAAGEDRYQEERKRLASVLNPQIAPTASDRLFGLLDI